jgi:biopolymer transport protein TolR
LKTNYTGIFLLFTILMFLTGCGKKVQEPVSLTGVPVGVVVALPREMKNAESDSAVLKESAVVVSVPLAEEFYLGSERHQKEELGERISRLLEGQPAANRIVYVAAGAPVDYDNVVQILDSVRKAGVNTIGLLVERQMGKDAPNLFKVQISAEPAVEDVLPVKPDPLTLLVSIGGQDRLQLNREPMGNTVDPAKLTETLTQVFQQRREHEKTVVIKAQRSTQYREVVRIIDAARGAGASPIVLQIDDLAL